jgi:hypothetical protein
MNDQETLRLIRVMYAGVQADAATQMERSGVLEQVTARKREEQMAGGAARARQLGINESARVPTDLSEIFRCADWKVTPRDAGFAAETRTCMLCAIAKKTGGARPCRISCLDPMEGMIRGLDPSLSVSVSETLWEGSMCRLEARQESPSSAASVSQQ